jgi:hypothetical protein
MIHLCRKNSFKHYNVILTWMKINVNLFLQEKNNKRKQI